MANNGCGCGCGGSKKGKTNNSYMDLVKESSSQQETQKENTFQVAGVSFWPAVIFVVMIFTVIYHESFTK